MRFAILFTYLMWIRFNIFVNGELPRTDLHSVEKMIVSQGYPYEAHEIITEDGYILTAHRIPHSPNSVIRKKGPVLIEHGLMCSSADFVVLGHGQSLGFLLSDEGYDVWLGNSRGTKYSRKHQTLDPDKDKQYWDFSWHEMGIYDLPSTIDYILHQTGCDSLSYVGHSQGTTTFFVMASERPEYNQKIRSMHAMGPAASLRHIKTPLIGGLMDFLLIRNLILGDGSSREFLASTQLTKLLGQAACRREAAVQEICANIFFLAFGYDSERLNRTNLPRVFENLPAGLSTKQLVHYAQGKKSCYDKFCKFDYDANKNQILYGQAKPPEYPLEKITSPVALYYGANDWGTAVEDVEKLAPLLPNLIEMYLVPFPKWAHMDFLWGIGVEHLVYPKLIEIMNRYAN